MKLFVAMAVMATLLTAQEKSMLPKPVELETAIIPVKTLSGDSFQRLANMLRIFDAKYNADEKLRTIVVYAPKETIAHMRKVIEALDRPGSEAAIGRNIQMTMTLLRCGSKPLDSARPVPADLEPVAKQLRAVALCKDVQLWDTVPLHLTEGKSTEYNSRLPGNLGNLPTAFGSIQARLYPEGVKPKADGRYVKFDQLRVNLRLPYYSSPDSTTQFQFQEFGFTTAGEFKEGQKSVIGKTAGADADSSVFFVIELKILE
ncbi:MAG: hypothetical protein U0R19_02850 [Bryobacteraceae bacterium]